MEIINDFVSVQSIRHTSETQSYIEHRVLHGPVKERIDPEDEDAVKGALLCSAPDSSDYENSTETLRPSLMVALKRRIGLSALGSDFYLSKTYARVFAGNIDESTK